ncbi:MaoC family dehydratase [Pluralibacter sp.]|jgi:3-hydroxybutyryl-CoA dehydratase|uniref:MaoC family dehydratase n=1 Tax=Pluralibacter sp. TaxID=1920032 RepID=UPI0025FC0426|nr:MaoC family dehydratase [Pluralibacter sp.]MBV8043951.1 MaoC family dehydratase [Pluralibacter sp.]
MYKLEEIKVGMVESYSQTMSEADVKNFANISGDRNPMHMDDLYAEKSRFGKRIVHGMFSTSFFSALFGTRLPGPGCIYVSQNIKFRKPVYIGDTVTAYVEVKHIDPARRRVYFDTYCKVRSLKVITGTAEIYIPE